MVCAYAYFKWLDGWERRCAKIWPEKDFIKIISNLLDYVKSLFKNIGT